MIYCKNIMDVASLFIFRPLKKKKHSHNNIYYIFYFIKILIFKILKF